MGGGGGGGVDGTAIESFLSDPKTPSCNSSLLGYVQIGYMEPRTLNPKP